MTEKISGYGLLIAGIATMVFSAFNIYQVFTRRVSPILLFNLTAPTLDLAQFGISAAPKQELLSTTDLNFMSNLTAHFFLMSFILNVGSKFASLGIQLIKSSPPEARPDKIAP